MKNRTLFLTVCVIVVWLAVCIIAAVLFVIVAPAPAPPAIQAAPTATDTSVPIPILTPTATEIRLPTATATLVIQPTNAARPTDEDRLPLALRKVSAILTCQNLVSERLDPFIVEFPYDAEQVTVTDSTHFTVSGEVTYGEIIRRGTTEIRAMHDARYTCQISFDVATASWHLDALSLEE
jgi:hypothetical protein